MKNSYLVSFVLFFLMLFVKTTNSQPYEAVINPDSTLWDFAHQQLAGNLLGGIFTGETVNNKTEIFFYFIKGLPPQYAGTIREETNTGQMWHTPPGDTIEFLIMDLSLQVGDTFQIIQSYYADLVSVYFINNRKIVELDFPTFCSEPLKFIEGVGPNASILYRWSYSGILNPFVSCKYNAGELVYVNNNQFFEGCGLIYTSINEGLIESTSIYPNPAIDGSVTFRFENTEYFEEMKLNCFDVFGKEVYSEKVYKHQGKSNVNIQDWKSGIYFVIVYSNGLPVGRCKFVVQ